MTFAEFLSLVEEYNLPVEEPERFRFMIKEMSADEFRAHLDKESEGPTWTYDETGLHDGRGNRHVPSRIAPDGNEGGGED